MPKTLNCSRNRSLDMKVFSILTVGFVVWEVSTAYFGLMTLLLGINFVVVTTMAFQPNIEYYIRKLESKIEPATEKDEWKKARPAFYVLLVISISILTYLVSL